MKKNTIKLACFLLVLVLSKLNAQLSGPYTVPGSYASIGLAIADLNTQGVSGAVTINIAAGHTETASVGGYTLNSITGASTTNSIVIQKSGAGANPIVYAYAGGVGTPATAVQDGVIRFVGTDFVTIDGIDITDPNTANPATMEFGYGFFKASVTNGCQNNTIKNCVITLNRINNVGGSGPSIDGSRGIDVVNATTSAHTTALTITNATGANSNNKFYSNTIQNCNYGISLIGFADATPFALADNGNDIGGTSLATGNTIINFGGGGTTSPAAGIRTLAQYGLNISYNLINNNNGSGVTHADVLRGIFINTATSANATVNSNTITLQSAGTTQLLSCIQNASGSTAAANTININNNLIVNCTYTSAATSAVFNGILNSGTAATVNINGNTINSIQLKTTGTPVLIETGSPVNAFMNTNTITSISNAGLSGTTRILKMTSPDNTTINNNLIDGVSYTNLTSTGSIDGIFSASSPINIIVLGNTVRNLSVPTSGTINGIRENGISGNKMVQNNAIYNFSTTTGGVGGATYNGIFLTPGTMTIAGNSIYSLNISGAAGGGGAINGIQISGGAASLIYKNKIYDISSSSTVAVVSGIYINGGTSNRIYNNLIGGLTAPAAIGNNVVMGLNLASGTANLVYFNTINLSGTSSSTLSGSSAVFANTANTLDLRNNILVNGSTPAGTAQAVSYRRSSTTLTSYSVSSNNNLFYGGTPGASNLIFSDGTNTFQTLTAFKTFLSSRDGLSVTENPNFVSILGASANFLNINAATPTQIESGALPIAGITDDYAATVRNVTTPDIGGWEGAFAISDITPPTMLGFGFTTPGCILTGRTFTASFSDITGVAGGALAPRIYYRLNAGAYTSVSGTLTSGTANNGVWTFSMTYAGALADMVSYFVVAQDAFGTPNLMAFPSAGFVGTDVNTITSNPTTPNTYGINSLNGVYTVGAAGTFTSLAAASIAYNTYCLTGPVTFSLTDVLYSTAETFPVVFLNNPDASATNSLLIRPAAGVAVSITPTNTAINSCVKFLNARYITIDGLNTGGSSITINNSNVSSASANIWLASTGTGNNFIAIKNTSLNGGYNTGSNGVIASIDGVAPSGTGGADNDNITITGNALKTFFQGVLAVGTASISSGGLDNWVVSNNLIGPATAGTSNIAGNGVYVNNSINLAVSSNTIQNVSIAAAGGAIALVNNSNFTVTANTINNFTTTASAGFGVNVNSNNLGFVISQNTITNLYSTTSSSGVNALAAIMLGTGAVNGTISANVLRTMVNTNTGGYGVRGMIINTGVAASNIQVRNNFISDIYSYPDYVSAGSFQWAPVGIHIDGTTGGVNIDFNTINLFGAHPGYGLASGGTPSSPLYVNATGGNLNVRNNIFSNTYDNTALTTDVVYAIYSAVSATNFATINNNNYYVGGPATNQFLGYLGANQSNLAGIQTAFGGNVNSTNILPVFVSNTDLHMQAVGGNALLDNTGITVAGIATDIDNQSRSLTTPDMGADEFSVPTCTNALGGTIAPTSTAVCVGQTLTATSTGVSTGLNTVYQWEAAVTSGGPYGNIAGGSGATTPSYTSGILAAGVYYVRLKTTCTTMTAASNEVTVTVNALPTAVAAVTSNTICSGQSINLNGSGTGTTYTWTGPNSFTSTTQSPVITNASANASGTYSLISTGNGCNSTVGVVSVTVNVTPSAVTVTPNSALICAGGSQTLGTSGGNVPAVFNFTPQTNQNSTTGYPAPYSATWGGQKMQMLILASELTAQGLVAGPITGIRFPVVSRGSSWGSTINDLISFQVSIKPTAINAVTGTFETGLSIVAPATNFTPQVGYNNIHNFTNAFNWDGTSNLIIETVFSNNFSGTANEVVIQYNSPTTFQSTMVYRVDSQPFATVAAATTTNVATSLIRPDFKLIGSGPATFTWSPATGLSSTTGATVNATILANTVYSVSALNGVCASPIGTATLNIAPAITVSIAATPTAVCAGGSTTLTASGATSYTWDPTNLTNTISVSPAVGTTVYTVTAQNGNCAAVTETISIVANALPSVQASSNPTLVCSGQSATLTGSGATTYAWVSGPATNTFVVSPTSGTTYTVTGTDANGCSDEAVVTVASGTLPIVAVSPSTQSVCASSPASFTASGAATYSWNTSSTNTVLTINPATSGVYTVTGFASSGCAATQTVELTAWALPVVTVSPANPTICISESVILTAAGATSFSWMPGTATTSSLSVNPSTTTSYSVEGVDANGCKGTKVVTVTVDLCTGVNESALSGKVVLYPNPSTGLITAEFGYDGTKNIVVLNSVGSVILNTLTQEQSATFDLSTFAKGVYFVNVKSNGNVANYKVVIQ